MKDYVSMVKGHFCELYGSGLEMTFGKTEEERGIGGSGKRKMMEVGTVGERGEDGGTATSAVLYSPP